MTTVSRDLAKEDKISLLKLIMKAKAKDFSFKNFEKGDINPIDIPNMTKVSVDGNWIGFTEDPEGFLKEFKELRSVE